MIVSPVLPNRPFYQSEAEAVNLESNQQVFIGTAVVFQEGPLTSFDMTNH
jgi:hypothetical protein